MHKNFENGRSMIEMLGVLAIIGVLSVAGIAGYSKAMEKFKINKTIQQITMIAQNIRTLFFNEDTYYSLDCENATLENSKRFVDLGIITPDMLSKSPINGNDNVYTYMINPLGGGVWIGANTPDPRPLNGDWMVEKAFVISYGGFDKNSCMELATKNWNSLEVYNIGINGNDGDYVNAAHECESDCFYESDESLYATKKYLPLSPSAVAKYCSLCDTFPYGCNILWGFRN